MIWALGIGLAVVCVGFFLWVYSRQERIPGGQTRSDRRRAKQIKRWEKQRREQGDG